MSRSNLSISLLIILISSILFIPFLGQVHLFDWDEINFAEAAREMLMTGDFFTVQIDYNPFWEKPPLFFWMQAGSMALFGVNEFAARFPNAIAGIATLIFLFFAGNNLYGKKFGLLWVIAYAGSILPHMYFKSGIIDPWFNLFIFSGIFFTIQGIFYGKNNLFFFIAGIAIGLAVLTKGPVGLLLFGLTFLVYFIAIRFKDFPKVSNILLFSLAFIIFGGLWFFIEIFNGRTQTIIDFFNYQIRLFETQDAGHGGPFYYHFLIILFGCFPASLIMLKAFGRKDEPASPFKFRLLMIILLFSVLIVFSVVKTKIVHYSSLAYFPVSFLAAWVIFRLESNKSSIKKVLKSFIFVVGLLIGLALSLTPLLIQNIEIISKLGLELPPEVLDHLNVSIKWSGFEIIPGLFLIFGSTYFLLFKNNYKGTIVLVLSTMISINSMLFLITEKIEKYSQAAAIEFYISKQNEDCYVRPLGFKSYAHLFYTKKQIPDNPNHSNQAWLLNGAIDKPVYFVVKKPKAIKIEGRYPQLNKIKEGNGFVFYERLPN